MWFKQASLVFMIIIHASKAKFFMESNNVLVENEFQNFVNEYKVDQDVQNHYPFCGFVRMVQSMKTRDIMDIFLRQNICPLVTINSKEKRQSIYNTTYSKTSGLFVFLDNYDQLTTTLDTLLKFRFWDNSLPTYFILAEKTNNTSFLNDTLNFIWSKNVLQFVIIFVYQKLEIFSYDPFKRSNNDRIINFTMYDDYRTHLFPNRVKNFYGAPFRILFFQHPPSIRRGREDWIGRDYIFSKNIAKQLNATLEIVSLIGNYEFFHGVDFLRNNSCDMIGISYFEMNLFSDLDKTYPHRHEELVLLVPAASKIPEYLYIFFIFSVLLWISLFASIFIVALLTIVLSRSSIAKKNNLNKTTTLIEAWGGFLQKTIHKLENKTRSEKIILIFWLSACLIITTAFQCQLTTIFINPKYYSDMDTIKEVRESGLPLYTIRPYSDHVPKEYNLHSQIHFVELVNDIQEKIFNLQTTDGFILKKNDAIQYCEETKLQAGRNVFHIVKEPLVPGYACYVLQKHSPYLKEINKVILYQQQFALRITNIEMIFQNLRHNSSQFLNNNNNNNMKTIQMHHLRGVFYIFTFGCCLSVLVFCLELFMANLNKIKKN